MKIYDYSRKRSTSKDIQFDQLDEEIRRIWDVLYNKREQYPNQMGGNTSSLKNFLKYGKSWAAMRGVGGGQQDNSMVGIGCGVNGANIGVAGTAFNAAPATTEEETAAYVRAVTSTAVEAVIEYHMSNQLTGGGIVGAKQLPYFLSVIKTEAAISDRIIFVGITTDPGTPPAAGNEHLPVTAGQFLNTFAFFYKPAALGGSGASNNWQIIRRSGGTAATLTDTGVLVETDKVYILEFTFSRVVATDLLLDYLYTADINYNQVFTFETNSPNSDNFPDPDDAVVSGIQPFVWIRNKTAATSRGLKINRVFAEWGADTDLLADTWDKYYGLTAI